MLNIVMPLVFILMIITGVYIIVRTLYAYWKERNPK